MEKSGVINLSQYGKGCLETAIDAEGYIGLIRTNRRNLRRGYNYRPTLRIVNTSREFLSKLRAICGDQGRIFQREYGDGKIIYTLTFRRGTMREILPQLSLIVKERQRKLLLEAMVLLNNNLRGGFEKTSLVDQNYKRLDEINTEIKSLNRG